MAGRWFAAHQRHPPAFLLTVERARIGPRWRLPMKSRVPSLLGVLPLVTRHDWLARLDGGSDSPFAPPGTMAVLVCVEHESGMDQLARRGGAGGDEVLPSGVVEVIGYFFCTPPRIPRKSASAPIRGGSRRADGDWAMRQHTADPVRRS